MNTNNLKRFALQPAHPRPRAMNNAGQASFSTTSCRWCYSLPESKNLALLALIMTVNQQKTPQPKSRDETNATAITEEERLFGRR
jgi:hypothetical protein